MSLRHSLLMDDGALIRRMPRTVQMCMDATQGPCVVTVTTSGQISIGKWDRHAVAPYCSGPIRYGHEDASVSTMAVLPDRPVVAVGCQGWEEFGGSNSKPCVVLLDLTRALPAVGQNSAAQFTIGWHTSAGAHNVHGPSGALGWYRLGQIFTPTSRSVAKPIGVALAIGVHDAQRCETEAMSWMTAVPHAPGLVLAYSQPTPHSTRMQHVVCTLAGPLLEKFIAGQWTTLADANSWIKAKAHAHSRRLLHLRVCHDKHSSRVYTINHVAWDLERQGSVLVSAGADGNLVQYNLRSNAVSWCWPLTRCNAVPAGLLSPLSLPPLGGQGMTRRDKANCHIVSAQSHPQHANLQLLTVPTGNVRRLYLVDVRARVLVAALHHLQQGQYTTLASSVHAHWSPCGQFVVSGTEDSAVHVWRVGELVSAWASAPREVRVAQSTVEEASFAPDATLSVEAVHVPCKRVLWCDFVPGTEPGALQLMTAGYDKRIGRHVLAQ